MNILRISLIMIIVTGLSIQSVYAHDPNFEIKSSKDILKFCEFFYQEYVFLGSNNLFEQHSQFPNLRACVILYKHIAWNSTHEARDVVLISEIEKYLGDSKYIKERHLELSDTIPEWVKKEAKLWINEENQDLGFAYGVRAMLDAGVLKVDSIERDCNEDKLCFYQNDFIKYSFFDKYKNHATIKYTVKSTDENQINFDVEKISKNGLTKEEVIIDKKGVIKTKDCCQIFEYMYLTKVADGGIIGDDLKKVAETKFYFDKEFHEVWLIKDDLGKNKIIMDKKTGLVMESNYHETEVLTVADTTKITDTNIFESKYNFNEHNIVIPYWLKETTKWLLDGQISDSEYLKAMENLISRKILKV